VAADVNEKGMASVGPFLTDGKTNFSPSRPDCAAAFA
jgi:hypothetical protein